jgi:hypothetical protein
MPLSAVDKAFLEVATEYAEKALKEIYTNTGTNLDLMPSTADVRRKIAVRLGLEDDETTDNWGGPSQLRVPAGQHGGGQFTKGESQPVVGSVSNHLFGRELGEHDYAKLAGNRPDANVVHYDDNEKGTIKIGAVGDKYHTDLMLKKGEDGSLHCHYNKIVVDVSERNGPLAMTILATQLQQMRDYGVKNITSTAARFEKDGLIGYKVWPKLGFDGPVPDEARNALLECFRKCKTVQELYALPGGRKAWEEHGTTFKASLDLTSDTAKKALSLMDKMLKRGEGKTPPATNAFVAEEGDLSFYEVSMAGLSSPADLTRNELRELGLTEWYINNLKGEEE